MVGSFLDQYVPQTKPAGAAAAAGSFLDNYTPVQQSPSAPAAAAGPYTPSPAGYIGGKLLQGALASGAALQQLPGGDPTTPAFDGGQSTALAPATTPEQLNTLLYGSPTVQAPGPVSLYAGAVAEAVGANPLLAGLQPLATIGQGLGSQAANDLGLPSVLGAVFGGGLGGLAEAGVRGLLANSSLSSLAKTLGESHTWKEAGEKLQSAATDWLSSDAPGSYSWKQKQVWADVDAKMHAAPMPGATPLAAPATEPNFTNEQLTDRGRGTTLGPDGQPRPLGQIITGPGNNAAAPAVPDLAIPAAPGMTAGPKTPIPTFISRLRGLVENPELGPLASAAGAANPKVMQRMLDGLKSAGIADTAIGNPSAFLSRPTIPQWDQVRAFSSWLGDQIANPKSEINSLGEKNLKSLYQALMEDQQNAADVAGAGKEFQQALSASDKLATMREQHIAPLVEPGVDPGKAAALAVKGASGKGGDGTRLTALRSELPEATDELAALHVQPGNAKLWTKLSPEAQSALVPSDNLRYAVDKATAAAIGPVPHSPIGLAGTEFAGMEIGQKLGGLALSHVLGHENAENVGAAAGLLLPPLAHFTRAAVGSPSLLLRPTAGAATGVLNPLAPDVPNR